MLGWHHVARGILGLIEHRLVHYGLSSSHIDWILWHTGISLLQPLVFLLPTQIVVVFSVAFVAESVLENTRFCKNTRTKTSEKKLQYDAKFGRRFFIMQLTATASSSALRIAMKLAMTKRKSSVTFYHLERSICCEELNNRRSKTSISW